MQIVKLDVTNSSHQCPPGTTLRTDLPRRLCGSGTSGDCSSTIFDLSGIEYSQVCGKIIGYQDETPDALILVNQVDQYQLTVLMLRVLVLLMAVIHASTSGLLQQPLMKWVMDIPL